MDTTRILTFRHPSQLDLLLDSLIQTSVHLPENSRKIVDRSQMPSQLQRIAIRAPKVKQEWRAWSRGSTLIFMTGELIQPLPKLPKCPLVMLNVYGSNGRVKARSEWIFLPGGKWLRADVPSVARKLNG